MGGALRNHHIQEQRMTWWILKDISCGEVIATLGYPICEWDGVTLLS
jgi:hypothetical protein